MMAIEIFTIKINMENKLFYRCRKCMTVSTRPRVSFKRGVCSACLNFNEKKKILTGVLRKRIEKTMQ